MCACKRVTPPPRAPARARALFNHSAAMPPAQGLRSSSMRVRRSASNSPAGMHPTSTSSRVAPASTRARLPGGGAAPASPPPRLSHAAIVGSHGRTQRLRVDSRVRRPAPRAAGHAGSLRKPTRHSNHSDCVLQPLRLASPPPPPPPHTHTHTHTARHHHGHSHASRAPADLHSHASRAPTDLRDSPRPSAREGAL